MAVDSNRRDAAAAILKTVVVFILDFLINVIWSVAAFAIFVALMYYAEGLHFNDYGLFDRMVRSPEFLFISCFYNVFAILLVYIVWRYIDKRGTEVIGLRWKKNSAKLFGLGLVGGTFEIALIMLLSMSMGNLWFEGFGRELFSSAEINKSIIYGIPAFLLVGFGEESVFRGYIQKRLMLSFGNKRALLVSSLIFMVAHLFTYSKMLDFIDVALGGIVLGYLYILTDSLYLTAAYHFIYDFIQVNLVRLQDYEHYKGAVLYIFGNSGDLVISGVNYGNIVEVSFIIAEVIILILLYSFRNTIRKLCS